MKEVTGRILSWDGVSQQGMIESSDGARYPFSSVEVRRISEYWS